MDKLESFFKSKKALKWSVVLICLALLGNLYLLLTIEDWSHHQFEVLQEILLCVALGYALFVLIKRYKAQNRQTGDGDNPEIEV